VGAAWMISAMWTAYEHFFSKDARATAFLTQLEGTHIATFEQVR
jgi:hypothetical protein